MSHAFRVGQLVALAQTSRDRETYEVVQLMPETPSGEPQYRSRACRAASFAPCARPRSSRTPEEPTPALPSSASASLGLIRRRRSKGQPKSSRGSSI